MKNNRLHIIIPALLLLSISCKKNDNTPPAYDILLRQNLQKATWGVKYLWENNAEYTSVFEGRQIRFSSDSIIYFQDSISIDSLATYSIDKYKEMTYLRIDSVFQTKYRKMAGEWTLLNMNSVEIRLYRNVLAGLATDMFIISK